MLPRPSIRIYGAMKVMIEIPILSSCVILMVVAYTNLLKMLYFGKLRIKAPTRWDNPF